MILAVAEEVQLHGLHILPQCVPGPTALPYSE